jgi:hypothetical protein
LISTNEIPEEISKNAMACSMVMGSPNMSQALSVESMGSMSLPKLNI